MIETILDFLGKLYGIPGYLLVVVSCVALGYVLKAWPKFPNAAIPAVSMLWGACFNVLLMDGEPNGVSHRKWIAQNLLVGVVAGVAACILYVHPIAEIGGEGTVVAQHVEN